MRYTLVLASASPRRQQLISVFGLPVLVRPTAVDERVPQGWHPADVVEMLSRRKAERALQELPAEIPPAPGETRIIIGCDTVVALGGEVMGKPADEAEARDMLRRLSGRTHEVYSGVTCIRETDGRIVTAHRMTRVRFRPLSAARIDRYVATGEPMDKAGAYGIQGAGALLVDGIEGCYFNVVGLPLSLLADMLESFGVQLP